MGLLMLLLVVMAASSHLQRTNVSQSKIMFLIDPYVYSKIFYAIKNKIYIFSAQNDNLFLVIFFIYCDYEYVIFNLNYFISLQTSV